MSPPSIASLLGAGNGLVGMLHLAPLPGSPRHDGDLASVRDRLLHDADAVAAGGAGAFLIENFFDAPFWPERVPAETVAHMTVLAAAVRERFDQPLGVNCLRNDGCAAMAIAHACGARFIRVNVLTGARVTDQGIVTGIAHELLRLRSRLGADVLILADVDSKHSAPLGAPRPLTEEVADLVHRGMADAVVVSGAATGRAVDPDELRTVAAAAGDAPVVVGSGVTADNIGTYRALAGGWIVGTGIKRNGRVGEPVDEQRVRRLVEALAR